MPRKNIWLGIVLAAALGPFSFLYVGAWWATIAGLGIFFYLFYLVLQNPLYVFILPFYTIGCIITMSLLVKRHNSTLPSVETANIHICTACKSPNALTHKHCTECGESITQECPHCKTQVGMTHKHCHGCGGRIETKKRWMRYVSVALGVLLLAALLFSLFTQEEAVAIVSVDAPESVKIRAHFPVEVALTIPLPPDMNLTLDGATHLNTTWTDSKTAVIDARIGKRGNHTVSVQLTRGDEVVQEKQMVVRVS